MSIKVISFYDVVPLKANKKSSKFSDIFETIYDEKLGKDVYRKTKTINRQAIMDSEAKNCDIAILYKKLIKGDATVLNTREGVYMDTSNVPKNIYEMSEYSKFVEKYFNENDLLKNTYKGDFNAYFEDYKKGVDFVKKKIDIYSLGIIEKLKVDEKKKESEVKKDETK